MPALIERSDQLVNLTDLARKGSVLFDKIASAENDRLVVLRKSEPIAVVLNISAFEAMLDEVEKLRSTVVAMTRLGDPAANDRLNFADLQQSLGF